MSPEEVRLILGADTLDQCVKESRVRFNADLNRFGENPLSAFESTIFTAGVVAGADTIIEKITAVFDLTLKDST